MDFEDRPQSLDEMTVMADQIPTYHRSTKSLKMLTTMFVKLLQEAKNGVLNLKEAFRVLAVRHKRRIYDITNVLEGVGLIVKISKNIVKWIGTVSAEDTHQLPMRLRELHSELKDLELMEYMLDQQKLWVEQSIRNTAKDCSKLTYVNHEDICNCFTGHTLLAVQAPSGTQLDVPIPKAVQDSPVKYQIYLKSIRGPIDVVLLNKPSVSSVPVVLPVPPPEEILQNAKLALSTSDEAKSSTAQCQASVNTQNSTKSRQRSIEDTEPCHASSFIKTEPNRTGASKFPDLSKELKNLLDQPKEMVNANLITKLAGLSSFFSTPPSFSTPV